MRLFEPGFLGESQAGQASAFNPFPQGLAKIVLQDFEFHERSIAPRYSDFLLTFGVQHLKEIAGKTRKAAMAEQFPQAHIPIFYYHFALIIGQLQHLQANIKSAAFELYHMPLTVTSPPASGNTA
jgi:hypothetical protein